MKRYQSLKEESEFKKWFGRSKIVDNSGKPLVVYHGTNKRFNIFDDKLIGKSTGNFGHYGYGFYFSKDIREAKTYGSTILEVYLRVEKPFDAFDTNLLSKYAKEFGGYEKKNIAIDLNWLLNSLKRKDIIAYNLAYNISKYGYERGWSTFLKNNNIENAIIDLNSISDWMEKTDLTQKVEVADYVIKEITQILGRPKLVQGYVYSEKPQMKYMTDLGSSQTIELTNKIKKDGYDGIIADTEIIVFYPNQIKSATDNNGEFSLKSNNIFEQTEKV